MKHFGFICLLLKEFAVCSITVVVHPEIIVFKFPCELLKKIVCRSFAIVLTDINFVDFVLCHV